MTLKRQPFSTDFCDACSIGEVSSSARVHKGLSRTFGHSSNTLSFMCRYSSRWHTYQCKTTVSVNWKLVGYRFVKKSRGPRLDSNNPQS